MPDEFQPSVDDLTHLADVQETIIDLLGRNVGFDLFLETLCELLSRQLNG